MVQHLYPALLENEDQYRSAEAYWHKLVGTIASRVGQKGEWLPWMPRTFVDGTPLPRDGNPIFEARSSRLARALQVIQSPPESDDVEIAAWLRSFDYSDSGGPGYTEEMTINLSLSRESSAIAAKLIELWMDPSVSGERMKEIIQERAGESSNGGTNPGIQTDQ
jgi:hypothetical protein